MQKSAAVVDSILKGYPIGTFIFWQTAERLRSVRNIGGLEFRAAGESEKVDFVLDGQQRVTSLYACFKGAKIRRADSCKVDDFSNIFVNLRAAENEPIVQANPELMGSNHCVSVKDLYEGSFHILGKFPEEYHERIDKYRRRIAEYQYSVIQLRDAPIDVATEVFTRINVGGRTLSLFEIMVAKTFDDKLNFDLAEKYGELTASLEGASYNTISDATVLQTVALIIGRECKRENILKIDRTQFIKYWPKAVSAIESATEYFRNSYRIPVSNLLPYNSLMAIFAYFFNRCPHPDNEQRKRLVDFFWRVALTGRYSSGTESKLAQDVRHMDAIVAGRAPDYKTPDWAVDVSPQYIKDNGWFSTGRAYVKAILCLYTYQRPKSFDTDADVQVGNDYLKRSNSKNYHHFFPKSYLEKQGEDWDKINHVLNITIVDDFLNKREIRDKKPSVYMRKFQRENERLADTMKTHLIDIDAFGVFEDDYDLFFDKRAEWVSRELSKRLQTLQMDGNQSALVDDYEEEQSAME